MTLIPILVGISKVLHLPIYLFIKINLNVDISATIPSIYPDTALYGGSEKIR